MLFHSITLQQVAPNHRKVPIRRGVEGLYVKAMLLGGNNYAFILQ